MALYAGGVINPGTMPVALATANFDSDSVTLYRNTTEFCDGRDDDLDGQTDENFPAGDTACNDDYFPICSCAKQNLC